MKCLYYLTSTLDSTESITDDLHKAGIDDWFIHVLSKDEAGLKKHKIHSSNYLEQLDILRFGIIGAMGGLLAGLLSALLLDKFELFGPNLPASAYLGLFVFWTLFGAWEGELTGIATENKKISLFHDDLAAGCYLLLIYAKQADEQVIRTVTVSAILFRIARTMDTSVALEPRKAQTATFNGREHLINRALKDE